MPRTVIVTGSSSGIGAASAAGVAEGVDTARALRRIVETRERGYRADLKFPIVFGVVDVLDGRVAPRDGLLALMRMPLHAEMCDTRRARARARAASHVHAICMLNEPCLFEVYTQRCSSRCRGLMHLI